MWIAKVFAICILWLCELFLWIQVFPVWRPISPFFYYLLELLLCIKSINLSKPCRIFSLIRNVVLSLLKPTSSVSSLLGSIGGKRRNFWIKGEKSLPQGTIGAGKASSFAIISCDSGSSMSSSSIVKPKKLFNPILFNSIQFINATPRQCKRIE